MDNGSLLCTDIQSIRRVLDLTDWYGQSLGAKLNSNKSEAQLFGPCSDLDLGGLDLAFLKTDHKILGLKFDGGRTTRELDRCVGES